VGDDIEMEAPAEIQFELDDNPPLDRTDDSRSGEACTTDDAVVEDFVFEEENSGPTVPVSYITTLLDVSVSLTVLLLFTPLRRNRRTKTYHPCYVEHLNFNVPKTARIHSILNSLCDNAFRINIDDFNSFGLAAIGYDLFFFQDRPPDKDHDEFKLILTERSLEKSRHFVGLRFGDDYAGDAYQNQRDKFEKFLQNHQNAFSLHLTTKDRLVEFRDMMGLHEMVSSFDDSKSFQECYFCTMIDFQKITRWRFGALNGQNRLAAALSFMIGCNYDLQDWGLSPGEIDPLLVLDVHASDNEGVVNKGYTIYGQAVEAIPQQQDLLLFIDRSRITPRLTSGVVFHPSLEIRLLSRAVNDLETPSVSALLDCLQSISQKRAVDERMLSNTSMPAKCSQIFQVLCDEIVLSHQQCLEFHRSYKGHHYKPTESFMIEYPDYCSESEDEGMFFLVIYFYYSLFH
jgi:hypothetical protein